MHSKSHDKPSIFARAPNYIKGISAYKTRVKYASNLRLNYTVKTWTEIRGSKEAEPH